MPDNATLQIEGPTSVEIVGATDVMGWTDNDDQISVDFEYRNEVIEVSTTGREPAEIVYVGAVAVVTFTLVRWDKGEVDRIRIPPGGTALGAAGIIGQLWIADVGQEFTGGTFGLVVTPLRDGELIYTFPRCYMDGPVTLSDWGNTAQRLSASVIAIRDVNNNIFTTEAVGTPP